MDFVRKNLTNDGLKYMECAYTLIKNILEKKENEEEEEAYSPISTEQKSLALKRLGFQENETPSHLEVRKAYFEKTWEYHPSRFKGKSFDITSKMEIMSSRVQKAYKTILNSYGD